MWYFMGDWEEVEVKVYMEALTKVWKRDDRKLMRELTGQ